MDQQAPVITFDTNLFSVLAVKKAAYRYMQAFTTDMIQEGNRIQCTITFAGRVRGDERDRLIDEFKKEVLDQDLRERLEVETEAVRNVILAHVFSQTGLIPHEPLSRD